MPFDGSGNYQLPAAPDYPAISGAVISSTYYNNVLVDIQTAMSTMLCKDGQSTPTGTINWNNQNITNMGNLSLTGRVNTAASLVGGSGLRVPPGTAPAAPTDGDVWSTTAGMYTRVNGVTYRLLGAPVVVSTVTTTAGVYATFSALSQNYSKLIFLFSGVSHNTASQDLQIQVSPDGASWSTARTLLSSVTSLSFVQGVIEQDFYAATQSTLRADLVATAAHPVVSPATTIIASPVSLLVNVTGGMDYCRFLWSGGAAFDAGSITCYAV